MLQIFKWLLSKIQKCYYYQELKETSIAGFILLCIILLYNYGTSLIQWLLTERGQLNTIFFLASIVIGIVIKMYYRIMVIKYHEKDTNIELYKEINKK
jgi:hypothetical protein